MTIILNILSTSPAGANSTIINIQPRLAAAVSFIFSPVFWVLAFFAAAYRKGFFNNKLQIVIVFTIGLFMPFIIYSLLWRTGRLTDLDISKRQERYFILAVANACSIILLIFLKLNGLSELYQLVLIAYIIVAASSLVTLFYKISFHMTFTYTFAILINYLYDLKIFYLLYLISPIMFWSRVYLKKHTVLEVASALILDSLILYNMLLKPTL